MTDTPNAEDRLLTLREAAELCGPSVTLKALRGRVDRGALAVEHSDTGERMVRVSTLQAAGLLAADVDAEAGEGAPDTPSDGAQADYAELYRERDAALRQALERAGAAEERATIYEARVTELEKLREEDRAAYDAERLGMIRELEGIRATLLVLQEPERSVPALPSVTTAPAGPVPWWRRMLGGSDVAE